MKILVASIAGFLFGFLAVDAHAADVAISNWQSDCLFNWAERTLPATFTPGSTSQNADIFYYRAYPKKTYLAVGADRVIYLGPLSENKPLDLGPAGTYYSDSGCNTATTSTDAEADIVRLLEQATMGPTEALVAEVKQKGIAAWLDEQLGLYESRYTAWPPYTAVSMADRVACLENELCRINNLAPNLVQWEFYRQAISGRDQLRQRFAYALHQLFVLGEGGPSETAATSDFHQGVRDFAFSTYEEALYQYTVSPQLGLFQGWANNVPEHDGIKPNENYAREILQLLTTGVFRLNEDGTQKRDGSGNLIPAYVQDDVTALSRVLTGFTYPVPPGVAQAFFQSPDYYLGPMVPFDQHHDQGAKSLFSGTVQLAAGQGADAEVRAAIHALVADSNVPPFICKQLIQRLVTSSPSPEYLQRVVNVFKDNGSGVRGDLKAVLRSILMDQEARGASKTGATYGRMREPALFLTSIMRALDMQTDGYLPAVMGGDAGMEIFAPSTIFSYFPADYHLNNGTLPAAEFGIYGTAAYVTRTNMMTRLIFLNQGGAATSHVGVPNPIGTSTPTMAAFLDSTADPAAFVARLNRLFFHGTLSAASQKTITNAVTAIPASDALTRAKIGVFLSLTSLDYLIQK